MFEMDKPMTFNEWMGTQGNMVLLHANCCRIAYEAGQQSQQAKVEEMQKRADKAIRLLVEAELYQSEPNIDLAVKALKGEG